MNKAIFIDRDGVINKLPPKFPNDGIGDIRNYITDWSQFHYLPGVIEAFELLAESDYKVIVVSNQGGAIGRGLVSNDTIRSVFITMTTDIWGYGLAGHRLELEWYFCKHRWDECCSCVKPKPGMLSAAAYDHNICMADSWMIGDGLEDMYAGYNAEIEPERIIRVGKTPDRQNIYKPFYKWYRYNGSLPYICRDSLLDAVKHILKSQASEED